MQIAARGFPEVSRSTKKMIKTENMNLKISRAFSLFVSNWFFISCRRVCHASGESPRFYNRKEKNIYRREFEKRLAKV